MIFDQGLGLHAKYGNPGFGRLESDLLTVHFEEELSMVTPNTPTLADHFTTTYKWVMQLLPSLV